MKISLRYVMYCKQFIHTRSVSVRDYIQCVSLTQFQRLVNVSPLVEYRVGFHTVFLWGEEMGGGEGKGFGIMNRHLEKDVPENYLPLH